MDLGVVRVEARCVGSLNVVRGAVRMRWSVDGVDGWWDDVRHWQGSCGRNKITGNGRQGHERSCNGMIIQCGSYLAVHDGVVSSDAMDLEATTSVRRPLEKSPRSRSKDSALVRVWLRHASNEKTR